MSSNSIEYGDNYFPFGHIHHSSWKRLEEICQNYDQNSEIRIHGCFYEDQCCHNLAIQLYGLLKFKKHWYNWQEKPSIVRVLYEQLRINSFDIFKNLSRTNIRYGAVFSSETIGSKNYFSFLPKDLKFIKYTNEQLTSEETKIFGRLN